jgi:hypothetical protein
MWDSSRKYHTLKVSEGTSDEVSFSLHQNAVPFYECYAICPEELENISLYEFFLWYEVGNNQYKRCGTRGASHMWLISGYALLGILLMLTSGKSVLIRRRVIIP